MDDVTTHKLFKEYVETLKLLIKQLEEYGVNLNARYDNILINMKVRGGA